MLTLKELRKLHDAGLSLLYLHPRSKRPVESAWTTTPNKSWAELKDGFYDNMNVGVRLGVHSKIGDKGYLACIDLDVKDPDKRDEALTRLSEVTKGRIFPVVMSGSGNGSRHLYCVTAKPFRMITIAKQKGWEICIYSTGRQMVLPPSTHPSGNEYRWASPFAAKRLPLIDLSGLGSGEKPAVEATDAPDVGFRAVEVDVWSIPNLKTKWVRMIEDGDGLGDDESGDLYGLTKALYRADLNNDQILSLLSDPNNYISTIARRHTKSEDRARAVSWLKKYTLANAEHETSVMRYFDNPPVNRKRLSKVEAEKLEAEFLEDKSKENLPDLGEHGKPKNTLRNLVHILEHYLGGGLVGFNEFSTRSYFLKNTSYGGKKGNELTDQDDLNLKHYIATHYHFEPAISLCLEAHTFVAHKYASHPVREYLSSLVWDKLSRLDTWLIKGFNAEGPDDYLRAISRKTLVAAVARIFEPGCKFDHVTVLEGNQGEGKSMSLGIMATQKWFTDSLGDIHNKDVVDQITGKWIIELSELSGIKGRENEAVKSFLSRQVDRVRMSYGRRSQDYPRQSIFIGSTNSAEYFTDETGNRRYWPVKVSEANRAWLSENRDQLWAEAVVRYDLGEELYLAKDIEAVAKKEQEKRFEVDVWEAEVKKVIKKTEEPYVTLELFRSLTISNGNPSDNESKRIGKIMRRLGFERTRRRISGVKTKCWMKKGTCTPC